MKYLTTLTLAALALSGCETFYNTSSRNEANATAMRAEIERQQLSRDAEIAKATAQSAEIQLQQLDARLNRLEDDLRRTSMAGNSNADALRDELNALKGEIAAIRADREKMKKEIINEISTEVAKLLAAQQKSAAAAAPSESAGQSGYEHKVQSGQTLSAIAQAYGVSVDKIKKANKLKNDVIRVGQTLFIPD